VSGNPVLDAEAAIRAARAVLGAYDQGSLGIEAPYLADTLRMLMRATGKLTDAAVDAVTAARQEWDKAAAATAPVDPLVDARGEVAGWVLTHLTGGTP
jgi:hypothetical protein